MNTIEINVLGTFSPDHKNVIDVFQPSMGLKRGVPSKCLRKREAKEGTIAVPWI